MEWHDLPKYNGIQVSQLIYIGSVRGSPNGTIGKFTNDTIGSQWYQWKSHYRDLLCYRFDLVCKVTILLIFEYFTHLRHDRP